MEEKKQPKILQLIPAEPGWHVLVHLRTPEGEIIVEKGNVQSVKYRVACWALTDECASAVVPMVTDEDVSGLALAHVMYQDYTLLTPVESYDYGISSDPKMPPNRADAEAIGISQSSEGDVLILWRWP